MASRLFVGNLSYDSTEEELSAHFSKVGPVSRVFIPLDRETGRPRGFAFIEFPSDEHAKEAIQKLHEQPFKERSLVVNEARPSEPRPGGGSQSRAPQRPTAGTARVGRPANRESTTLGGGPSTRPAPIKSKSVSSKRKRGGKKGFREEEPKKEPLKEKIGGRFFGNFDDPEDGEEDIDFENFATSEPEGDEDE